MTSPATDVVVVGGGPAGWGSAIAAATHGLSVALVEPRNGVVDKACGEGLMPAGLAALGRLGVAVNGQPLHGVRYTCADGVRGATARFLGSPGLGVRRTDLSAALSVRAAELGVVAVSGRVTGLREDADGIRACVTGERQELRASYAVVADGLHSPLRRQLGWQGERNRRQARYGFRRHYRVRPGAHATDLITVLWAGDCEAYVTPLSDDVVNVAVLCGGGRSYHQLLENFPALGRMLEGAEELTPVRGAGPLRQRASRRAGQRIALVGDAAGYVDALTGEGIGIAISGAEALAGCLARGSLRTYPAAWRRVTARPRLLTELLLAATSTRLVRRHLVPASERLPRAFGYFVNALA